MWSWLSASGAGDQYQQSNEMAPFRSPKQLASKYGVGREAAYSDKHDEEQWTPPPSFMAELVSIRPETRQIGIRLDTLKGLYP